MDFITKKPAVAIVMPFWTDGSAHREQYLLEAVQSILQQTSPDWNLFIVDDCSGSEHTDDLFPRVRNIDQRINIHVSDSNKGPGNCRNIGVRMASAAGYEYVGFLDADDIAPADRVAEVIRRFGRETQTSVIYSGFRPMGPDGVEIPTDELIEGMRLLNSQLATEPLRGLDIWKTILCRRDGLTIPSSLNVRTALAMQVPFPSQYRFHEDTHTWVCYSAAGAFFEYVEGLEARYRVLNNGKTSESRIRAGGIETFNKMRCEVAIDSLDQALQYAARRHHAVDDDEATDIRRRLYLNLAAILEKEGSKTLATYLRCEAGKLDTAIVDPV